MTNETDKIVEAVARALCLWAGANWDAADFNETPSGESPEEMRDGFRDQARAAILAHTQALMENVSEEELNAGASAFADSGSARSFSHVAQLIRDAMLTAHKEQMKCKT